MNTYWSQYVQKTEELYVSRALKFGRETMDRWVSAMGLQDGMHILEVGCAGGLLCHRIKEALPNTILTGIDLDSEHIAYARKKSEELKLPCDFVEGDATNLPFADGEFDLCYSHTVINFCGPEKFIGEQYRVLKPGGKIVILCVCGAGGAESWEPTTDCEEKELFDRVWAAAAQSPKSHIKRFEDRTDRYFPILAAAGFHHLSIDAVATVTYAPDCDNISDELARAQIGEDRIAELCSAEKAYAMAPESLTNAEYQAMIEMINRRFDKKIREYEREKKSWEFRIATTAVLSGTK